MTSSVCFTYHGCMRHTLELGLIMPWYKANLVLQDTIEQVWVGNRYGDIPRGVFLVRGENVVLLGEIVCSSPSPSICG